MEFRSHRPHHFFPFRAAEPSEGIGGELEIRDGTTVQTRRQVEVSQLFGPVFRHLSALPKGRHLLAELRHLQLRIAQAWGRRNRGGLSFLKTYSAARTDPRRTTRATVSVVGPGGKIATVASADMHKLNGGAVFFFSMVSAHRKRAARFLQHLLGQMPLSVVRPRGARTGDEVLRLEETQLPFRRRPTGRAVRRAYPSRAPSACETRGSRRGRNKGSVGDGAR